MTETREKVTGMIDARVFIAKAEEIAAEEPRYKKGGDGDSGYCDCIGLIIGAIRRAGGQWRGMHGSNYAARREMDTLQKINGSAELVPGEVVYKAYEPGQGGYNLPGRYEHGGDYFNGDLRDYYHIGIVTSVYPLRIRHMNSPRSKVDTSIGKWAYHGKLKKVELGEGTAGKTEGKKMETVIIGGGDTSKPIHMRQSGSTKGKIVADIPQGSTAELLEGGGVWNEIKWNGKTGYVMATFVKKANGGGSADQEQAGENISVSRAELEKIYDALGDMLGLRG